MGEIRERRAERFWEGRMAGKAERELASDKKEVEDDIHLVRAPASLLKGYVAAEEGEAMEEEEVAEEAEELVAEPKSADRRREKVKTPKIRARA